MKTVKDDSFWKQNLKPKDKRFFKLRNIFIIFLVSIIIVAALFITNILAGTLSSKPTSTNTTTSSKLGICKYEEINPSNILALINEQRAGQKLPDIKESEGLSRYQQALILEMQAKEKNEDLRNISTWQEKNLDKSLVTYIDAGFKGLSVSNFSDTCGMVDYLMQNNSSDLLSPIYDVAGVNANNKDVYIMLAKRTSKTNQIAGADSSYLDNLRNQQNVVKQEIDNRQEELDKWKGEIDNREKQKEEENKYKEFLSQIVIAISAENYKSGFKPFSASCSSAGSINFSYISGKLSSASTSHGSVFVSSIGDKVSSISGLGSYHCNYIGDYISSCSAPSGSVYISSIGDQISSTRNNTADVTSYFSHIGGNISSVNESSLGNCNIR